MIEPKSIEEAIIREAGARLADMLTAVMPENYSICSTRWGGVWSGPAVRFRLKPDVIACGHSWDFSLYANCEVKVQWGAEILRFDLSDPDCFDKIVDTVLKYEDLI